MIFGRVTLKGQSKFYGSGEITGGPAGDDSLEGYRLGGWFPVENFGVGITEAAASKENAKPATPTPATPRSSNTPAQAKTPQGESDQNKSQVTVAKKVDLATCELMVLAMEERSQKKGKDKNKEYHADFHIVGSVHYQDSSQADLYAYPSLMVHLEGVRVVKWDIHADAEGRPSETVTLQYDRLAMHYLFTRDGKEFFPVGPKGWDQEKSVQWPEEAGQLDKVFSPFLPKF